MLGMFDSFNSLSFFPHSNHYAFWLRKQIPNIDVLKMQIIFCDFIISFFFIGYSVAHIKHIIVLSRLTIYCWAADWNWNFEQKENHKNFFWLCFAICVFSPENCCVLMKYCPILIKAWYTDPDLNTLDLTGTHNNQAQNSSHHHLHSSTLGNSHTTPNTGSSNIAGTTQAVTATRTGSGKFSNENDSECSSVTSDSMPGG